MFCICDSYDVLWRLTVVHETVRHRAWMVTWGKAWISLRFNHLNAVQNRTIFDQPTEFFCVLLKQTWKNLPDFGPLGQAFSVELQHQLGPDCLSSTSACFPLTPALFPQQNTASPKLPSACHLCWAATVSHSREKAVGTVTVMTRWQTWRGKEHQ